MNNYKPVKFTKKKRLNLHISQTLVFRVVPIILVVVIAVCGFNVFDKKISEIIANQKYSALAARGNIDDPTSDGYTSTDYDWESAYSASDPNGFDPLALSPLGLTNGLRPSSILGSTDFETAMGYTNKQSTIWSLHDSINSDIIAWIYIPGMGINYPIAQDLSDSDYYLTHSYDKTKSTSGTLFFSSSSTISPISRNLIVHGHNMRDGTMFATLNNYLKGTRSFYDAHKYIFIDTLYGTYRYEIYSVYKTDPDDIYLTTTFGSKSAFLSWCDETNSKGIFSSDVEFSSADRVLTLSTCDATAKFRIIVHARLCYPKVSEAVELPYDDSAIELGGIDELDSSDEDEAAEATPTPYTDTQPVVTPKAPSYAEGEVYVVSLTDVKSTLRLRKGPGTNYTIEAALAHGTRVTIQSTDGDWVKVKTDGGLEGYLQKAKLVPESEFSYTVPTGQISAPDTNLITPTPVPAA